MLVDDGAVIALDIKFPVALTVNPPVATSPLKPDQNLVVPLATPPLITVNL